MAENKTNTANTNNSSTTNTDNTNSASGNTDTSGFQTYLRENKDNINIDLLSQDFDANQSQLYQEWKDTGSIGKKYFTNTADVSDVYTGTTKTEGEATTTTGMAEDIISSTTNLAGDLQDEAKKRKAELEEQKTSDEERITRQAEETEKLIKEQDAKIAELEDTQRKRLKEEQSAEVDRLKEEQDIARATQEAEQKKLEAEAEYQKTQNENAIIEAKANIETQRQQSAWAYQKLGLGFSSGIINQSQKIATDGYTKIAEIKAKMNYNEAITGVEISKVKLEMQKIDIEYSGMINSVISEYSNKLDDLDMSAEKRIQETTQNLLLNSQEKENAINDILKEYRTNVNTLEDDHIKDMMNIQDRAFQYQQQLEASIQQEKEEGLTVLSDELLNGNIAGMSDTEIANRERQLGLPSGTIKQKQDGLIRSGIRGMVDEMIGSDYVVDNMTALKNKVIEQMGQGRTLQEAVDIVGSNYIKGNEEYKRQQTLKKAQQADALAKATGTGRYAPTTAETEAETGDVGRLIALAEEYGEELSPARAKELVKGGDVAVKTYLNNLEANPRITEEEPKQVKTSDASKTFLETFADDYDNKEKATTAYNQLIKDGYNKEQALNLLVAENPGELEVQRGKDGSLKLIDTDYFGDDTVLTIQ